MQDVNWAPTVRPISIFLVARYLPLALLTPLSALCVEAAAQTQYESTGSQINNLDIAALAEDNSQAKVGILVLLGSAGTRGAVLGFPRKVGRMRRRRPVVEH